MLPVLPAVSGVVVDVRLIPGYAVHPLYPCLVRFDVNVPFRPAHAGFAGILLRPAAGSSWQRLHRPVRGARRPRRRRTRPPVARNRGLTVSAPEPGTEALRPIYTAPNEAAATERFLEFAETWGERYPAIVRLWENTWAEFVPFLDYGACCENRRGCVAALIAAARLLTVERAIFAEECRRSAAGQQPARARWILARLKAVAARCSSLVADGQAAARESAEDRLEVADARFDGRAAALVELCAVLGAQPVPHQFPRCRLVRGEIEHWLGSGCSALVTGLAQRDQPVGSGRDEVGVAGVAGVGEHGADHVLWVAGVPALRGQGPGVRAMMLV